MGATLSYLGYASHQQPYPQYHENVSQQLHQDCGPTLIHGNADSASPSIIDLCARLAALEKELQISRAGNANKEAVIQYLLQSSVSNARVKEIIVQLKEQLLVLKTTVDRTNKENEEIKDRLVKAEDTIFALSTASFPNLRPQSTSTSFSSRSDSLPKSDIVTEDLIDLLGCSQESDNAKLIEEGTTLLDQFYDDESDVEGVFKNTTPDQSLLQSYDSEFEGPPYITHFADSDEDENAKSLDAVEVARKKLLVARTSSDLVTPPQQQNNISVLSENSDESSPVNSSSRNGCNSIATSFSSMSSGISPLNDVDADFLNEGFSQLKALGSEGDNLDKSMAIVRSLAGTLSSFGARNLAEPSRPADQAPAEPQNLQTSVGAKIAKPRWSPYVVFDSVQDYETAVSINRRSAQAGARDVPYPDFFRYGIYYVPKTCEQDAFRTVAIAGLPQFVTMEALLERVRGGMLIDAKLLDTAKITGSNTALVTFLHERSAKAYENHAKKYPIAFSNAVAQVAVVPTPTWPIPVNIRTSIEEFGRTRCFEVHRLPRTISLLSMRKELTASPVMKSDSLECMTLGADGVLRLRFASIRAAELSSALFSNTLRFKGCTVKCIPDPCAQPLETLLEQRTNISEVVQEDTPEPSYNSEAKTPPDEKSGRLTKTDWTIDSELRRGRGFKDRTLAAIAGYVNVAGHSISPSSVSTEEPLRQENPATIAAFAKSFSPSA